jgi:hypothetical protein
LGAFPAALRPETGLSAPILCTPEGAHKYFRFNPLRGGKPGLFSGESAAVFWGGENFAVFLRFWRFFLENRLTDIFAGGTNARVDFKGSGVTALKGRDSPASP